METKTEQRIKGLQWDVLVTNELTVKTGQGATLCCEGQNSWVNKKFQTHLGLYFGVFIFNRGLPWYFETYFLNMFKLLYSILMFSDLS